MNEQNTTSESNSDIKEASSFGSSDPTDGKAQYDWKSSYPEEALKIIRVEAFILVALFLFSFIGLLANWCGASRLLVSYCCDNYHTETFELYTYFSLSGLLAGTTFSMKWLYHAVARGFWHIDRQLWRFMTPITSMGVAFIIGTLVLSQYIENIEEPFNPTTAISIGFVAGYFSDNAIAKMLEIANVIFGTTAKKN